MDKKILEKSRNFVSPEKWEPCKVCTAYLLSNFVIVDYRCLKTTQLIIATCRPWETDTLERPFTTRGSI